MPRILRLTREALASLAGNSQRTVLMMLGITIGIATLTVVICIGQGTRERVMSLVARHGLDTLMIRPGSGRRTGIPGGDRSLVSLTQADADAIEGSANVTGVAPVQSRGSLEVRFGESGYTTQVFGVTPIWARVREFGAARGEFIQREDLLAVSRVCLLGQTVVEALFGDDDPIGETVRLGTVPFTVKGVLIRKGASVGGGDRDNRVVIPLTTASKRVFARDYLNQIMVQVRDVGAIHETAEHIRTLLRQRHGLRPDAPDDFSIREPTELIDAASGTSGTLTALLLAISGISLLAGGIVIMNIMLISISARQTEIGLRRAVGARRRDIIVQTMLECGAVTLAAGVIGVAFGAILATLLSRLGYVDSIVTWQPFAASVTTSAAIALTFSIYPARRAAGIEPVRALQV